MENTKILTEAQIKALEDLSELIVKIVDLFVSAIKVIADVLRKLWKTIIENYPNRRVIHLALHHKSLRVRKKNITRIMRWLRRYIRCRE